MVGVNRLMGRPKTILDVKLGRQKGLGACGDPLQATSKIQNRKDDMSVQEPIAGFRLPPSIKLLSQHDLETAFHCCPNAYRRGDLVSYQVC